MSDDPTVHHLDLLLTDLKAKVDKADLLLVSGFEWRLLKTGYVCAQRGRMYLYLHRLIAGAGEDEVIDHINRDPLDNRRNNLRIATRSQNSANRRADVRKVGKYSTYKGVSFDKSRGCWFAYIHYQGKTRSLGRWADEHEAAEAYNRAALETWGEFARLNIVLRVEGSVQAVAGGI